MDRKILGILVVILLASGCSIPDTSDDGGNTGPDLAEDRGLQIESFRTSDETLRPSQEAVLTLVLKNYHTEDLSIEEISIYNEGDLNVGNKRCTPEQGELGLASEDNYPEMECQWDVEAPSNEYYQSFESKPASLNLRLTYESSLTNEDPFKLEFKPLDEVNASSDISRTFSNSEVSMNVETEDPVPIESGRTMTITTKEIGQGRIASDSEFSYEFRPEGIFGEDCERSEAPVVQNEVEFSCSIGKDGSVQRGTRNLVFSTYYKYVKEPVLNIKLVNDQ